MKAEFLKNQLIEIFYAANRSGVREALASIISLRYQYQDNVDAKTTKTKEMLELLRIAANDTAKDNIFSNNIIENGIIDRFLSRKIFDIINQMFVDFGVDDTFFQSVVKTRENYESAIRKILDSYFAFDEFGVAALEESKNDIVFIEIVVPDRYRGDLEVCGRAISEQARILKLLSESFGQSRIDFPVYAVTTSKLSVYIKANYQYATYLSAVLFFLLNTAATVLDLRLKNAELSRLLEKDLATPFAEKILTDVASKCSERIQTEFFNNPSEAAFDAEKCAAGAKLIYKSIEDGFRYEMHIPNIKRSEENLEGDKNFTEEKRRKLTELADQIRINFNTLPEPDGVRLIAHEDADSE
jgi:hypothetical protein